MEIGESRTSYLFSSESIQIDYSTSSVTFSVNDDAIVLAVFDDLNNEAVYLERYSLKDDLENQVEFPFSADEVSKVFIVQSGGKSTVVPNQLKELKDHFLSEHFNCSETEISRLNFPDIESTMFFKSSKPFLWLCEMFPNAEIGHSLKCMVDNALQRNKYQRGGKIYIDVSESTADIVIISDNHLITAISENFTTQSDLFYQILSRIESSGFNQLEDILFISGLFDKENQLYKDLSKYVKEVRLHAGFKFQKVSREIGIVPKHKFFNVINAYQCA